MRCRLIGRRSETDYGQAAVEFALILPLFIALIVALFDATVIVRDQLLADSLARDAARQASQATQYGEAQAIVAGIITDAQRPDATWQIRLGDDTITTQVSLVPRASMFATSLRWLGALHSVVGIATFATEYELDDQ